MKSIVESDKLSRMESINKIEAAYRTLQKQGQNILKLYAANPVECGFKFPPEILKSAYLKYFDQPHYTPDPKGLLKARQAISHYYEERKFLVSPANTLITAGTSESFFYLFKLLCQPGDSVLAPIPSYPLFESIAGLADIKLEPYELNAQDNWQADIHSIRENLHPKIKAIVLISPHNPTGSVISAEKLAEITFLANQHGIPIICDEVFSEFIFNHQPYPRIAQITSPNLCFTLNGLSKLFALPAFKLGWITVTGQKNLVDPAMDQLEHMADTFLTCHTAIQESLPELFEKGKDFLGEYKREITTRAKLTTDILDTCPFLDFVRPAGGFYLSFTYQKPDLPDEEFVISLMKQKNIFIHPGYFFDFTEDNYGVISFLHPPEILQTAFHQIIDFIESH
ncbi:MAG: hypothetical protein ACD_73C00389G0002 [uncultured bacterium]|nr:MAG: hypothetical protein ACD_73C00389G0002 [uncultured bacterium]